MDDCSFATGKSYDKDGRLIRNRLNLAQRIEVIKEYQRRPDLGYLADRFQCGRRQIKHIMAKRSLYLSQWNPKESMAKASTRSTSPALKQYPPSRKSFGSTPTQRQRLDSTTPPRQYIDAIETILNEWMHRAKCYRINITDDILINFANEIASQVGAKNFNAENHVWLAAFKKKYNFADVLFVKQEPGTAVRKPLSIAVIIRDLQKEQGLKLPEDKWKKSGQSDGSDDDDSLTGLNNVETQIGGSVHSAADSTMQIDDYGSAGSNGALSENGSDEYADEIDSYKKALNKLGPLEQFALLRENVRAVGLINQLETIFRNEMAKN